MKGLLFIVSFLFPSLIINPSKPIIVKLNPQEEKIIDGRDYYISKVIDDRDNRSKLIGKISKKEITFDDTAEAEIMHYLTYSYPSNKKTFKEITLVINSIDCENEVTLLTSKIKVNMEVEFRSSSLKESYKLKVSNGMERLLPDGKSFATLIERNLDDAMKELQTILSY